MAKVIKIYLFLILMITIITLNRSTGHPIAKNDLISGKDFLSIYIGRGNIHNERRQQHPIRRRTGTIVTAAAASAVTDDDMSTAESSYFIDYDHTKSIELTTQSTTVKKDVTNQSPPPNNKLFIKTNNPTEENHEDTIDNVKNNDDKDNNDDENNEDEIIDPLVEEHSNFDSQKIVKLVTSGSKIIFLEESPTIVDYSHESGEENNQNQQIFIDSDDKLSDSPTYEHESVNKITNYQTSSDSNNSDEIKIISVRISSSETRSQPNRNFQSQSSKLSQLEQPKQQPQQPQKHHQIDTNHQLHPIDDTQNDKVNILISNVAKSDFSIEEKEPFTLESQQQKQQLTNKHHQQRDSLNEESINIESIFNVPVVSSSLLSQTSNTYREPHSLSIKPNLTSTSRSSSSSSSISSSNSATIRTTTNENDDNTDDDETLPSIQTIIIHDQDYTHHKEGNARPRSVSYSSISQSVNPKWKSDLENHKFNRSQQIKQQQQQIKEQLQHVSSEPAQIIKSTTLTPPTPYKFINDEPEQIYSEPAKIYSEASKVYGEPSKFYSEPAKIYSEPSKIYGEPEKIYSEPAKIYSEPAKIYSEPSKIYSKPSEIYGEPSKMYGEPSKVYSLPAGSVYTTTVTSTTMTTPRTTIRSRIIASSTTTTTTTTVTPPPTPPPPPPTTTEITQKQFTHSKKVIFNLDKLPYDLLNAPAPSVEDEQKNYLFAPQLNNQRFHHFTRKSEDQEFQQGPLSVVQRTTNPNNRNNYNQNYQKSTNYRPSLLVKPINKQTPLVPISSSSSTTTKTTTTTTTTTERSYHPTPEQNYEVDEAVSVMTNGKYHGIVTNPPKSKKSTTESHHAKDEQDPKVGFVVEGRNFRKYRVEEKTPDGFIVGEYGVVSNNDGSLRGVRYTADENISPNLIYEALMKFLSL